MFITSILWVFVYWPFIFGCHFVIWTCQFLWRFRISDVSKFDSSDYGFPCSDYGFPSSGKPTFYYANPIDWFKNKKTKYA